ncbi:MAG: hypothetical protein ACOH5I_11555 [Oligoflexus sp.]
MTGIGLWGHECFRNLDAICEPVAVPETFDFTISILMPDENSERKEEKQFFSSLARYDYTTPGYGEIRIDISEWYFRWVESFQPDSPHLPFTITALHSHVYEGFSPVATEFYGCVVE